MNPFTIERVLDAPIDKVWNAIANPEEMKQWYFDLPGFKAEVGYEFDFIGETPAGTQYKHLCKVTVVEHLKKLAYTWRYDGYAGDSEVTWELFVEGSQTRLKLTHAGLDTFPANSDFAASNFAEGWNMIVGTSLPEYLTK